MADKLKVLSCLCILLAVQSHAEGRQKTTRVASKGETTLTATSGTTTINVTIYTHELRTPSRDRGNPRQPDSNCVDSRMPCSIVDSIRIIKNGNPVFVFRSVYADLGDLNDAELTIGKEISTLRLSAGDGAEGYFVKIEFDDESVQRRTVGGAIDFSEPNEQTVYHVVTFDD